MTAGQLVSEPAILNANNGVGLFEIGCCSDYTSQARSHTRQDRPTKTGLTQAEADRRSERRRVCLEIEGIFADCALSDSRSKGQSRALCKKSTKPSSFPRRRESSMPGYATAAAPWIPACAGMTERSFAQTVARDATRSISSLTGEPKADEQLSQFCGPRAKEVCSCQDRKKRDTLGQSLFCGLSRECERYNRSSTHLKLSAPSCFDAQSSWLKGPF